jgi:hypothetical protein
MEDKKQPRKYQRREFIKATGKGILGAGIGGLIGYITGKTYRTGRDFYREDIKPIGDAINPAMEKLGETKERVGDWYNKYFNKEEYQKQQEKKFASKNKNPEKTSRRGFLSKYFHIFNENPIGVGTTTGIALGGLIKTLKLYPQYIQRKKVAQLKDEHIEYAKKIKILEDYKEQLEERLQEKDNKIEGLKDEIETIKQTLNIKEEKPSKLEKEVGGDSLPLPISMIISGTFLFFTFILLNGINYTGFVTISKESLHPFSILNFLTIIVSFSFITIGIFKLRRIRKLKHRIKQKKK